MNMQNIKEISEPKGYVVLISIETTNGCIEYPGHYYKYYYHTKNTNLNELIDKVTDFISNFEENFFDNPEFPHSRKWNYISSDYEIYKIVYIEKKIVIDELIDEGYNVNFYKKKVKYYYNDKTEETTAVECKASHYLGFETEPIWDDDSYWYYINEDEYYWKDSEQLITKIVTKKYDDGKVYEGQMKNGLRHGRGKMVYVEDDNNYAGVYVGEWKNDKKHGKGKMVYDNGDVYDGKYKDDYRYGYATYTFADGSITYGGDSYNWKDGRKDGPYYWDECGPFEENIKDTHDPVTFKGFAIQSVTGTSYSWYDDKLYSYHEFINFMDEEIKCHFDDVEYDVPVLWPNIVGLEDDGIKENSAYNPIDINWETSYTYQNDDFDYANDILKFPNSLIELIQRKAISTLKNKLTPYLQHHLYKPGGKRMKQVAETTLVGKKHRKEKDISTLTNKVFLDIIYFIYEMLLE